MSSIRRVGLCTLALCFAACSGPRPVGSEEGDPSQVGGLPAPFPGDAAGARLGEIDANTIGTLGPQRIAVHEDGSLYVAGYVTGTIEVAGTELYGWGFGSTFLMALDRTLTAQWARQIGGPHYRDIKGAESQSAVGGLVVDPESGDVLVSGTYSTRADFGEGEIQPPGGGDGFVARYAGAGALRWVRPFDSPGLSAAYRLGLSGDAISVLAESEEPTIFGTELVGHYVGVFDHEGNLAGAWQAPSNVDVRRLGHVGGLFVVVEDQGEERFLRAYVSSTGAKKWESPISGARLEHVMACGPSLALIVRTYDGSGAVGAINVGSGPFDQSIVLVDASNGNPLIGWPVGLGTAAVAEAFACNESGQFAVAGLAMEKVTIAGTIIEPSPNQALIFVARYDAQGQGLGAQIVGSFSGEATFPTQVTALSFDGPDAMIIAAEVGQSGTWAGLPVGIPGIRQGVIARLTR